MKSKYFLATVLFIGFAHTSQAENHTLSPKLAKDFEMAVKNVENKNCWGYTHIPTTHQTHTIFILNITMLPEDLDTILR